MAEAVVVWIQKRGLTVRVSQLTPTVKPLETSMLHVAHLWKKTVRKWSTTPSRLKNCFWCLHEVTLRSHNDKKCLGCTPLWKTGQSLEVWTVTSFDWIPLAHQLDEAARPFRKLRKATRRSPTSALEDFEPMENETRSLATGPAWWLQLDDPKRDEVSNKMNELETTKQLCTSEMIWGVFAVHPAYSKVKLHSLKSPESLPKNLFRAVLCTAGSQTKITKTISLL